MLKRNCVLLGILLLAASLHASAAPAPSEPGLYHGRTVVKSFGDHRVAVAIDDGEGFSHIFRFWTDDSLPTLDASYASAKVEFFGNELRVIVPQAQNVLRFNVGRSQRPYEGPEGFNMTGYSGFGLNHEIRPAGTKRAGGSVTPYSNCEPNCGEPIFEWPDDGVSDCTAGGAGSTSCSVTAYGVGCTASCDLGYYACCKVSLGGVSCSCVRK